jgi:hypothetical protein
MIRTTFANGINPFSKVSYAIPDDGDVVTRSDAVIFTKHTLAHFFKEHGGVSLAQDAADYFKVEKCRVYRHCTILAKEGAIQRTKVPQRDTSFSGWEYGYQFVCASKVRYIDHANAAYDYLVDHPGSLATDVRDKAELGLSAHAVLMRMIRSGRVRRDRDGPRYKYWAVR